MKPELPEPDFRLSWRDAAYYVSKPNIDSTDVFIPETVQRLIDEAYAAGMRDAREWLGEAGALLRRVPPVTRSMYVGSDKVAWGRQAADLASRIAAALPPPPEQPK